MLTFPCSSCGKTIGAEVQPGTTVTCPLCQQVVTVPVMAPAVPSAPPTDTRWAGATQPVRQGLAVTSMVLGILGLLTACVPILSIIALVLGIVALVKASQRPAEYGGKGFAIAGVCLGGLSLVLLPVMLLLGSILLPSLAKARELAKRSVCTANLLGFAKGMEIYANQYGGQYPPDVEALLTSGLAQPTMFACPSGSPDVDYTAPQYKYTPGQPIPPKLKEVMHSCYQYIPGQTSNTNPGNVLMYEKKECHSGEGGNVLFGDDHVEWITPYSKVEQLVKKTQARLAGDAVSPEAPE